MTKTHTDLPSSKRPLSPHLSIYKPQISSVLSITHRASGVFLCAGIGVFVFWLWMAAYCPDGFTSITSYVATCPICKILMVAWTLAFFFHFMNGIRHLFWDAGFGFTIPVVDRTGWIVVIGALLLTGLVWCPILSL